MLTLSSTSLTIVAVIGAIGLAALVFAFVLRRQVLAAPEGTAKMQDIAQAIQEGASAYLNRQFRTLALFAVIVFGLLFLLPGDAGIKVGRSVAFLVGAGFSRTWPPRFGSRCAPTCASRRLRPGQAAGPRARASPSAPGAWWGCPSWV